MENGGRNGMGNGGRNGMENGVGNGMENGARECILNQILKWKVGLVLSDTSSTPTGGEKNKGESEPQNSYNHFGTKTGIIFATSMRH